MRGEISEKRVENKRGSIVLAASTFTQSSQCSKEKESKISMITFASMVGFVRPTAFVKFCA